VPFGRTTPTSSLAEFLPIARWQAVDSQANESYPHNLGVARWCYSNFLAAGQLWAHPSD